MMNNNITLFLKYLIEDLDSLLFFKEYPNIDKSEIKLFLKKLLNEEKKLYIYTDGASRGNPGKAGAGFVIYNQDKEIIKKGKKFLGKKTNNEAEYYALILALKSLPDSNNITLNLFLDSELVVKQINGEYKVRNSNLKPLFQEVMKLLSNKKYKITHIPRKQNKLADKLANEAIDEASY